MTITQLTNYQGLVVKDYKDFSINLATKSRNVRKGIIKGFDYDLWILSEVLLIILAYQYSSTHNAFTNEEMNQWRDIFNDITNGTSYVNFNS